MRRASLEDCLHILRYTKDHPDAILTGDVSRRLAVLALFLNRELGKACSLIVDLEIPESQSLDLNKIQSLISLHKHDMGTPDYLVLHLQELLDRVRSLESQIAHPPYTGVEL